MDLKEIMEKMEQLNEGQALKFRIPQTFGGSIAVIELNQNKRKKYLLKLGKDENVSSYFDSDKLKDLAKWIAERMD